MANAKHDSNRVPTITGVSSVDGDTIVPIQVNPTTGAIQVDGSGMNFIDLGDTPASYSGQALKYPQVNAGETALEFISLTNPMTMQGSIAVAADFPTSAAVQTGWVYIVTATVTDNDASKTNTGLSFADGDEIMWDGSTWIIISRNMNVGTAAGQMLFWDGTDTWVNTEASEMIWEDTNKQLILGLLDTAATPALAFGDGDTGFYESSDDVVRLSSGGIDKWIWTSTAFGSTDTAQARITREAPTSTNPVFVPAFSDANTGIGWAAADQLSLISGGVEGLRVTEDTSTIMITQKGGQAVNRTDAGAADYNPSALTSDYIITADNTAAARAITISTEDCASGTSANPRVFIIKDEYDNATANSLTVTIEGGTIDGGASAVINSDSSAIGIYCYGTTSFIF